MDIQNYASALQISISLYFKIYNLNFPYSHITVSYFTVHISLDIRGSWPWVFLTFSLPGVTKDKFLLTISIQYPAERWWEAQKIILGQKAKFFNLSYKKIMSGKHSGKRILKSWSESVNHCLNKLEGHHFKSFHFPEAVPPPLISFSEVHFFIPVKTLMAPCTKLPSPLVNACIRFPNKCGQASGQSQYAMAEIAYAWKYIVEISINLQVLRKTYRCTNIIRRLWIYSHFFLME